MSNFCYFIDMYGGHVDRIDTPIAYVDKSALYRHMQFDPKRPYNNLRLLPPAIELETRSVLKACIAARAALAELNAATGLIPNPNILINTIPVLEAQSSSEIENIVTTTDELFKHAQSDDQVSDPATKEALRYRTALWQGFESLMQRPLSTRTCVEICSTLKGRRMDIRAIPGAALQNQASGETIYTPPEGERLLRELLANWERYCNVERVGGQDIDPLVRMAVQHYQFEAIHPFSDGNGRTGRILNILFVVQEELLDLPILYLSRAIINQKADYYRLLQNVTQSADWEQWILFMLDAVSETAHWTTRKIRAISALLEEISAKMRQEASRIYSREFVELIFAQPYMRIARLVEAGIAKRQTASVYLKTLCEIGVLSEIAAGREKLFINEPLMRLLTDNQRPTA